MDENLREAERIAAILAEEKVPAVVIGAVALAAHRYVRSTLDVDFGVDVDLRRMRGLLVTLRSLGYDAQLREPDADDPLGGVIDIPGAFGLVQIVNFGERFPAAPFTDS